MHTPGGVDICLTAVQELGGNQNLAFSIKPKVLGSPGVTE